MIAAYHYVEDHSPNNPSRANSATEGVQTIKGYVPAGRHRLQLFCRESTSKKNTIISYKTAHFANAEHELNFVLIGPLKFQLSLKLDDREFSDTILVDFYRDSFDNQAGYEAKSIDVPLSKAIGNSRTTSDYDGMPFFPGTLDFNQLSQTDFRSARFLTYPRFTILVERKESGQHIKFDFTTRLLSDVDDCFAIGDILKEGARISMYADDQRLENSVDVNIRKSVHTIPLIPEVAKRYRERPIFLLHDGSKK